ncbi:hypothetical protein EK904_003243 [Melospiza melodia maxima]|nr:hypothetical protein EK904_003243 [Melospiza melodia maxima]
MGLSELDCYITVYIYVTEYRASATSLVVPSLGNGSLCWDDDGTRFVCTGVPWLGRMRCCGHGSTLRPHGKPVMRLAGNQLQYSNTIVTACESLSKFSLICLTIVIGDH